MKRGMSDKRGQAAMEFLLTYGWAILVVLVVIGALSYFGVLNPSALLPDKCQFAAGITCQDYQLTTDDLSMQLQNSLGRTITVTSIVANDPTNNAVNCTTAVSSTNIANGGFHTFQPSCGFASGALTEGSKVRLNVEVHYTFASGTLDHVHTGEVFTTVQQP